MIQLNGCKYNLSFLPHFCRSSSHFCPFILLLIPSFLSLTPHEKRENNETRERINSVNDHPFFLSPPLPFVTLLCFLALPYEKRLNDGTGEWMDNITNHSSLHCSPSFCSFTLDLIVFLPSLTKRGITIRQVRETDELYNRPPLCHIILFPLSLPDTFFPSFSFRSRVETERGGLLWKREWGEREDSRSVQVYGVAWVRVSSYKFLSLIPSLPRNAQVGNVVVPVLVVRDRELRAASTSIFIVNLVAADLLVLVVCLPTLLSELYAPPSVWVLPPSMCEYPYTCV